MSEKILIPEKSYLYYSLLTLTKLKDFMSYTMKLHCYRGDVQGGEQEIVSKEFSESFGPYIYYKILIKRSIFVDSDETEIRLTFYRSFSTFWTIFGGLCTHVFDSWVWVRGDLKSCVT